MTRAHAQLYWRGGQPRGAITALSCVWACVLGEHKIFPSSWAKPLCLVAIRVPGRCLYCLMKLACQPEKAKADTWSEFISQNLAPQTL